MLIVRKSDFWCVVCYEYEAVLTLGNFRVWRRVWRHTREQYWRPWFTFRLTQYLSERKCRITVLLEAVRMWQIVLKVYQHMPFRKMMPFDVRGSALFSKQGRISQMQAPVQWSVQDTSQRIVSRFHALQSVFASKNLVSGTGTWSYVVNLPSVSTKNKTKINTGCTGRHQLQQRLRNDTLAYTVASIAAVLFRGLFRVRLGLWGGGRRVERWVGVWVLGLFLFLLSHYALEKKNK